MHHQREKPVICFGCLKKLLRWTFFDAYVVEVPRSGMIACSMRKECKLGILAIIVHRRHARPCHRKRQGFRKRRFRVYDVDQWRTQEFCSGVGGGEGRG